MHYEDTAQQILAVANVTERPTDWNQIDWTKANRTVCNLRQRIYRAAEAGDLKKVRSLQRLMLRSYSNAVTSVRRVTQTNKGKNTPGVDKLLIKTPGVDKLLIKTPKSRGVMVDYLCQHTPWKARPARRVYIPKKNGKMRPLGIPTIVDRCLQAMVKNALEPFWEQKFEATSYGFRPGRGCHDAIGNIYNQACPHRHKKWVVDADIKAAFDKIGHDYLLNAIGNFPARELVKQWLKAGVMENGAFSPTEEGTPQGGVVSPLLANIALHGMEAALDAESFTKTGKKNPVKKRAVVRYADDFVVFCNTEEDAHAVVDTLRQWLQVRGLELSEEKTRIVHLSAGFDFLGFTVRQYEDKNTKTGWKLLITPSRISEQTFRDKLKAEWLKLNGQNVSTVLKTLNPKIRGWVNYFRVGVASQTFNKMDAWMFTRERRYALHTHPNKGWTWIKSRYFGRWNLDSKNKWVFGNHKTKAHLLRLKWFPIQRHIIVKGKSSPDDPTLREYWAARLAARAKDLPPSRQKIARKQNFRCPVCGDTLFNDEELHVHHVEAKAKGGANTYKNFQLLHLYCHQQVTARG